MITPTRHRPILTFVLLMIIFLDPGRMSFVRISRLVPPSVLIRVIFSLSISRKPGIYVNYHTKYRN